MPFFEKFKSLNVRKIVGGPSKPSTTDAPVNEDYASINKELKSAYDRLKNTQAALSPVTKGQSKIIDEIRKMMTEAEDLSKRYLAKGVVVSSADSKKLLTLYDKLEQQIATNTSQQVGEKTLGTLLTEFRKKQLTDTLKDKRFSSGLGDVSKRIGRSASELFVGSSEAVSGQGLRDEAGKAFVNAISPELGVMSGLLGDVVDYNHLFSKGQESFSKLFSKTSDDMIDADQIRFNESEKIEAMRHADVVDALGEVETSVDKQSKGFSKYLFSGKSKFGAAMLGTAAFMKKLPGPLLSSSKSLKNLLLITKAKKLIDKVGGSPVTGKVGKRLAAVAGALVGGSLVYSSIKNVNKYDDQSFFGQKEGEGGVLKSKGAEYGKSIAGGALTGANVGLIAGGPIGAAIGAAIGGVVAGASTFVSDHWDVIGPKLKDLGDTLKSKYKEMKDWIKNKWSKFTSGIRDEAGNITFSSVTDALGLGGLKNWIKNKWGKYTEGIRDEAGNITFSSVTDALGLKGIKDWIKNKWSKFTSGIRDEAGKITFSSVTGAVTGVIKGIKDWIKNKWSKFTSGIRDEAGNITFSSVTGFLTSSLKGITDWVGEKWRDFTSGIRDESGKITLGSVTGFLTSSLKEVTDWIKNKWVNFTKGIRDEAGNITFSSVTDALGLKGIKDWIKNKWSKFTSGIRDEAGKITFSSVTDALGLKGIKDWIKNKWGKYTEGIRDEAGNITFSSITGFLTSSLKGITDWVGEKWRDFTSGIRDESGKITLGSVTGFLTSSLKEVTDWIKNKWSKFTSGIRDEAGNITFSSVTDALGLKGIKDWIKNKWSKFTSGIRDEAGKNYINLLICN